MYLLLIFLLIFLASTAFGFLKIDDIFVTDQVFPITSLCAVACAELHKCSSYAFKELGKFYADGSSNRFGSNCVFLSNYGENFMAEAFGDYDFYIGLVLGDEKKQVFFKIQYDVETVAASLGYNLSIDVPGTNSTRFYKQIQVNSNFEAEELCANEQGIIAMEESEEIMDAISELLGSSASR